VCRRRRGWEFFEQRDYFAAMTQVAAGQLADDVVVTQHLLRFQQLRQPGIASPEVINPHRRVDEDHKPPRGAERRRRTGAAPESEPPSAASRRALARAISASRPAWIRAVFSSMRVSRRASASRRSSMFNVVFICINVAVLAILCNWRAASGTPAASDIVSRENRPPRAESRSRSMGNEPDGRPCC
jgi:hypothetical protein